MSQSPQGSPLTLASPQGRGKEPIAGTAEPFRGPPLPGGETIVPEAEREDWGEGGPLRTRPTWSYAGSLKKFNIFIASARSPLSLILPSAKALMAFSLPEMIFR